MSKNNYFQFKQFRIEQAKTAMRVGIDGVLLGAWAANPEASKILDVGTGTGLIALMMAQRYPDAQITALEIDDVAFQEALKNIAGSGWQNRIEVKHISFQQYLKERMQTFDLIVSNPPYFKDGSKAQDNSRAIARHNDSLLLEELFSGAVSLLDEEGVFAMIYPIEHLAEIEHLAKVHKLHALRICRVKPNPQKPAHRLMIELTRMPVIRKEEELMIEYEHHHDYTPEYRELTKDFYLKF